MKHTATLDAPGPLRPFEGDTSVSDQARLLPCNVGGFDRALRVTTAAAALTFALGSSRKTARTIGFAVAAMATFSALTRYCPFNSLLHLNTCRD